MKKTTTKEKKTTQSRQKKKKKKKQRIVDELAAFLSKPRRPFGDGHKRQLAEMWGLGGDTFVELDLSPDVAKRGDDGTPLFFTEGDDDDVTRGESQKTTAAEAEAMAKFTQLAAAVWAELASQEGQGQPAVAFDGSTIRIDYAGESTALTPADLRLKCRCAACVAAPPVAAALPPNLKPITFTKTGNYAVAVLWSDGHQSLFPFKAFVPEYLQRRGGN
mmetsp:Transcript_25625/g.83017  ORF Transcript_25625/g.83017 Transcript_25625/m.83017 type:complete len:218 (+) Transcript_25625:309-962(+)